MSNRKKHKRPPVDFDTLLSRGARTYDSPVGQWWRARSLDPAHRKAYRHIAQSAAGFCQSLGKKIDQIVDYACGNGALLEELRYCFPRSALTGLDGSRTLLLDFLQKHPQLCTLIPKTHLFRSAGTPIQLCRTSLPDFSLPAHRADLVFLVFPNLVPDEKRLSVFNRNGYCDALDSRVGRMLARFREMDPEDEIPVPPPDELYDELMTARVFSRNLRHLLKRGGILVRAEYSQAPREQLSELTQWRNLFSECALDIPIKGESSHAYFRFMGSEFRRSKVILDVFHQTGNPDDTHGGYMLSFFEAL